jgi:epoxyqueuosine reductase
MAAPGDPVRASLEAEALRQQLCRWGASAAGFGDIREGLAPELRHLPIAIAIGVSPPAAAAAGCLYNHTTRGTEERLLEIQKRVVSLLRAGGHRYLAIPPDSHRADRRFVARLYPLFSHKTAATCAGLGWVGRSGLLIHPQFGPRLLWASVLTDAPLPPDAPVRASRCGGCERCVQACPAGAIRGRLWRRAAPREALIDREACAAEIEANRVRFGQSACGRCLMACPFGQALARAGEAAEAHATNGGSSGG